MASSRKKKTKPCSCKTHVFATRRLLYYAEDDMMIHRVSGTCLGRLFEVHWPLSSFFIDLIPEWGKIQNYLIEVAKAEAP